MGSQASKEDVSRFNPSTFADHEDSISCIAVSDDKSMLATGSEDKTIRLWGLDISKVTESLGILRGHTDMVSCVTIFNYYIISGSADTTVRIWNAATCECLDIYRGHSLKILRVICTGDNIISASTDKTVKVWKFENYQDEDKGEDEEKDPLLQTLRDHTKTVLSLIFIPDIYKHINFDMVITGSADCTARLWNMEAGTCDHIFMHKNSVTCMVTDNEAHNLYTGSMDGNIYAWDISHINHLQKTPMRVMEHGSSIISLHLSNRLLYSGAKDGVVRCWATGHGDCTQQYKGHTDTVISIIFYKGILYTGCGDSIIRAYDASNGVLKATLTEHEKPVTCLAICRDMLYSGSDDTKFIVWDISSLSALEQMPGEGEGY